MKKTLPKSGRRISSSALKKLTTTRAPSTANGPLDAVLLRKIDAWWRAANYLSVGQTYLYDNPLLNQPLDNPAIDAAIIQYVSTFVPKMTGQNYNPHVSTGVGTKEYLDQMLAEPFENFTFSPAGAAVYQLGPFGTAARKLKEWDLRH